MSRVKLLISQALVSIKECNIPCIHLKWSNNLLDGDIDLVVDKEHITKAASLIKSSAEKLGAVEVFSVHRDCHIHLFFAFLDGVGEVIHIDLQSGVDWNQKVLLSADQILSHCEYSDGSYKLSNSMLIALKVIRSILKEKFKEQYWREAKEAALTDSNMLRNSLSVFLGKELGLNVFSYLYSGDHLGVLSIKSELLHYLGIHQSSKFKSKSEKILNKLKRLLTKKGIYIELPPIGDGKDQDVKAALEALLSNMPVNFKVSLNPAANSKNYLLYKFQRVLADRLNIINVTFSTQSMNNEESSIEYSKGVLIKALAYNQKNRRPPLHMPDKVRSERSLNKKVTFVGLDGAGKGTYISLLKEKLVEIGIPYNSIYLGYSGYELGIIKRINYLRDSSEGALYKFYCLVFLMILPFEFFKRSMQIDKRVMTITDRHPLFETIKSTSKYTFYDKLLHFIAPKPDLVIYLTGDTITLWERKKEHPLEVYENKKQVLDDLILENFDKTNIYYVDTAKSVEDVFVEIQEIIL